ncbi:hypothetical protein [Streptomyces sp. Wb2n-11]|uniref:DUF7352 domain-containing protein n=1 Tax=Streptomyces sp. Wb2n-11 TaxID=1030533 RepID=UPI000A73047C|nr:hypothetical protein [Streptomyces sp. Wb2n-11]
MDTRVIDRFEIPIDDRPHLIDLIGSILHAACRRHGVVDVWAYARPERMEPMHRTFQVVGTGQSIPAGASHVATAITPYGTLVWHILESHCPHSMLVFDDPEERPETCPLCGARMTMSSSGRWIPV